MAEKAYRAVFLRVHPTGKMVLSLTTESDGRNPSTRRSSPTSWGAGPRCQGGPGGHRSLRRRTRLQHEPLRGGRRQRSCSRPRGSATRRDCWAGAALDTDPDALTPARGGWAAGDGSDPAQVKTIEDIALYAHGTGALPPGVEGGLDAQAVYRD